MTSRLTRWWALAALLSAFMLTVAACADESTPQPTAVPAATLIPGSALENHDDRDREGDDNSDDERDGDDDSDDERDGRLRR